MKKCLSVILNVGICRRLTTNLSSMFIQVAPCRDCEQGFASLVFRRTLASWILTVVVPCKHFWHTRDNSLLHTPLIDVPWLFPSSSQDDCSILARRVPLSVRFTHASPLGTDLVTPRLCGCEAGCTRTLGTSSRPAVCQAVVARCAFHSVAARSHRCVYPSETSTCRSVSTLRRAWVNSTTF